MAANNENIITLVGVVVPLMTIAGSALAFVWNSFRQSKEARRREFFELMERIDTKGTIAVKAAAVYQLRFFPEHREFVVRFCEQQLHNIEGDGVALQALAGEFEATRLYCLEATGARA